MKKLFTIIGIGEVLFDVLPNGKKMLGGASANFAYIAGKLGNRGIIASRIGRDNFGEKILEQLNNKQIDTSLLQIDEEHPSGLVRVDLQNGQPNYEIIENVAWDYLVFNKDWQEATKTCDAVCFGSLAQRNLVSRKTIQDFVKLTKSDCLKIFDINLRQNFYSQDVLCESLQIANILKLNHEELPQLIELFSIKSSNNTKNLLRTILQKFNLRLVCLTRGEQGSILLTEKEFSEQKSLPVEVKDTIGAGDAFTATLTHGLLHKWNLQTVHHRANRVAGFVASKNGAMPDLANFELD